MSVIFHIPTHPLRFKDVNNGIFTSKITGKFVIQDARHLTSSVIQNVIQLHPNRHPSHPTSSKPSPAIQNVTQTVIQRHPKHHPTSSNVIQNVIQSITQRHPVKRMRKRRKRRRRGCK